MEIIKHFEIYIAAQKATGIQFVVFGVSLLVAAILIHFGLYVNACMLQWRLLVINMALVGEEAMHNNTEALHIRQRARLHTPL